MGKIKQFGHIAVLDRWTSHMTPDFDPYHRWLGVPPKHQPTDHYRLLAIERFEDDSEVIADAAERQMAHVRRYALGPHQDISQRILNELAAAKACLLQPDKKAEYDRKLREQLAPQEPPEPPFVPPAVSSLPAVNAAVGTRSEMPLVGAGTPVRVPVVTDRLRRAIRLGVSRLPRPQMSAVAVVGWGMGGGILLGLLVVVIWSLFSGGGVGDVAQAGRHGPFGEPPAPAESAEEAKRHPEPAKTETSATPEAKPAEPPEEEAPKPEPARKESEKTEPAAKDAEGFADMGEAEEAKPARSAVDLPQEIENSIGMRLKLIPAREFLMGSPDGDSDADSDEKPQHLVRITKPFYLGVTEVTQGQYERVMGQNPSHFKGDPQRPVEMVSWEDAVAFCRKLSEREQEDQTYRLPTEAEWECACRADSTTKWSFGDDPAGLKDHAWYGENSDGSTHPVAQKEPNAFGLYDMHGNVWEWCADCYGPYSAGPVDDPTGPGAGSYRVSRGGRWRDGDPWDCRSTYRDRHTPALRYFTLGFRVACSSVDTKEKAPVRKLPDSFAEMGHAQEKRLPKSAAAPLPEIENSIGMRLKLIPAREFPMGSPDSDSDADSDEKPQHLVRITKPFYLGVTEVTQEQYERVMGQNPSGFKGDPQRPVEMVSWEDAVAFCRKLSEKEGRTYRLPTEAEWECACRAGSTTKWSFGDDEAGLKDHAWFDGNSDGSTHPVAQKEPNAFGLYDMHGNVWEWCADWDGPYSAESVDDPTGAMAGSDRVFRGGSWYSDARHCRSANRNYDAPTYRDSHLGFRVACSSVDTKEKAPVHKLPDSFDEMGHAQEKRLRKSAAQPLPEIENSIGMKLKLIPAGEFLMGSPEGDSDAGSHEKPQHLVRISKPFYLGVTEVTQQQYERVMGQNPSHFKGDPQRPVERVSWEDAVAFCRKLSDKEGQTYRLPTEAEWECACRAGSTTKWSFGDQEEGLKDHAWYRENSDRSTHPVAQKEPNAFGLYDMHGNVWEWCADWHARYYVASPTDDPPGPESGAHRVLRGGSRSFYASGCRSAFRGGSVPGARDFERGFRVASSSVDASSR